MGKIIILPETTKNPITLIGLRTGVCYGADVTNNEKNYKRGMECVLSNHGRTLEYVNVEMIIDGYSARVIREYYTHIGGNPTRLQASTRYIDYATQTFTYIIPHSIKKNKAALVKYKSLMSHINNELNSLENSYNIPKEDVANGLPLGMATKVVDKRNLRNLIEMSHQRLCMRTYWEFRELFADICDELSKYSEEWKWLVNNLFKSKCDYLGYCPENKSCGKIKKKENESD